MNQTKLDDAGNVPMLELFRVEAENQTAILTGGLLELERGQATAPQLEMLMRAAHSLKGAARIVNFPSAVQVAHAMEDCFSLAQQGKLDLRQKEIDYLLRGVDLLGQIAKQTEASIADWDTAHSEELQRFLATLPGLASTCAPTALAEDQPPASPCPGASRNPGRHGASGRDITRRLGRWLLPPPRPIHHHSPPADTKTRNGWCG